MKEIIAHQIKLENYRHKDLPMAKQNEGTETPIAPVLPENSGQNEVSVSKVNARKLNDVAASAPVPKRPKTSLSDTSAKNFLGIGAKRARQMKSARKAAAVGLGSKKNKMAHTGSGFRLNQVIRLRYVKGFTQAVRTPCRQEEIL